MSQHGKWARLHTFAKNPWQLGVPCFLTCASIKAEVVSENVVKASGSLQIYRSCEEFQTSRQLAESITNIVMQLIN